MMMSELENKMLGFMDVQEEHMLSLWRQIVQIESPSHYKAGVDAVGAVIARFCKEDLGYHIRFQHDPVYGNCLAACSCNFEEYRDGIALSAHMDTVHALGTFDPVIEENNEFFYGPGAGDCKGGIILMLLVAGALKHIGYSKRPIKLLFAADEESGGPTGRIFYPNELAGSAVMFNAESGLRDRIVTGRKSSIIARYDVQGEAAHIGYITGAPKSAIREAAMKLLALEDASDYDTLTFCGGVISGGTVATSAPEHCVMEVNVRIKDERYIQKALDILKSVCETTYVLGTSCSLEIRGNTMPMSEKEGNIWLYQQFSSAAQSLGFPVYQKAFVGGASDASYAAGMSIPVICATGPVVDYQHTRNERVLKASMLQRAKIHAKTILDLPDTIPGF